MFGAFTSFGKLGSLARAIAAAWTPSALWPTGTEPGMWIDPSNLTSQWQDSTGTTPVSPPGTVADSSNPVGLALDLRLGALDALGPELVTNGDFSDGSTGWTLETGWSVSDGQASITNASDIFAVYQAGLTPGKTYFISFTITSISGGGFTPYCGDNLRYANFNTVGTHTAIFVCGANGYLGVRAVSVGTTGSITNISFKEVPGNHLLQATSTARPLVSARVNWVNRDSDINPQTGELSEATLTQTAVAPPIGTGSVYKLVGNAVATQHRIVIYPAPGVTGSAVACFTFFAKAAEVRRCYIFAGQDYGNVWFDTMSGTCGPMPEYIGNLSYSITSVGDGWYRCQMTVTNPSFSTLQLGLMADGGTTFPEASVPMDGLGMYLWGVQAEFGLVPGPYQSIVGNGSSYSSTGFPIYQKYDGTDDGMATASFAAGTLTNAMDCMIPVRRDSAVLPAIGGLYQADQTKYFGVLGFTSGDTASTYGGCGTPTIFVDGVEVPNERGALFNAMTVGDFHILEYRGLDLSAWVNAAWGAYPTYLFNGARGDIMLFPSTASTEDKDAARQYLADKYGVTLA